MHEYLKATHRSDIASAARSFSKHLRADDGARYSSVIDIDLSSLEPHINGPFTPDLAHPISEFASKVTANNWPVELKVGLIGEDFLVL